MASTSHADVIAAELEKQEARKQIELVVAKERHKKQERMKRIAAKNYSALRKVI